MRGPVSSAVQRSPVIVEAGMFSRTITTHRANTRVRVRHLRYALRVTHENQELRDANIGPQQGYSRLKAKFLHVNVQTCNLDMITFSRTSNYSTLSK